jgi:hypothetical protein
MIPDRRVKEIAVGLLRQQSDRDKQKLIGASDFSDPCSYHLAKKLMGEKEGPQKYWLGAKIGTGVHTVLETAIENVDLVEIPELDGALVEQKIILGELPGYGIIKSKPDLAMVRDDHLIDWKTTVRDKTRRMKRVIFDEANLPDMQYTLEKYYAQTQSYAKGLIESGIPIDGLSIVFVNRDGTTEDDIWTWSFEYNPEYAQKVWDRLVTIWEGLSMGFEPDKFDRHPECFKCKVMDPA